MALNPASRQSLFALAAGLSPMLVAASDLASGLALAGAFLCVFTVASAVPLLLPQRFKSQSLTMLTLGLAAIVLSLYSSILRILDPLLFELLYRRLFIVLFLAPVMTAARAPSCESERDRAWEELIRGAVMSLLILAMGFSRELLSTGAVSLVQNEAALARPFLPVMAQPAGAFMLLALGSALTMSIIRLAKRSNV
jgi:Ca2+/Na+ antiporter